jgi:aerobic-type carbon monoxide dehydrogenase small subunit (CoxS/CutS family)
MRLKSPASGQPDEPLARSPKTITVKVNGQPVQALAGDTVAGLLLAQGIRVFRQTADGAPRGLFCGMGICYDCLVMVNDVPHIRACMTQVVEAMTIETRTGVAQDGES